MKNFYDSMIFIYYYNRKYNSLKPAGLMGQVQLVTESEVKL